MIPARFHGTKGFQKHSEGAEEGEDRLRLTPRHPWQHQRELRRDEKRIEGNEEQRRRKPPQDAEGAQ